MFHLTIYFLHIPNVVNSKNHGISMSDIIVIHVSIAMCGYETICTMILTSTKVIQYIHICEALLNKKTMYSILCVWLG